MRESGIVFYFESNDVDVWSGRDYDLSAWNYACKVADIKKAIIINKCEREIFSFDAGMDIQIVSSSPENLEGHITQIVCPWEETPSDKIELWDFDHQTDWYLFGSANGWVGNYSADSYVTIPQEGIGAVHSVHAATTVMFHRYKTLI